MNHHIHGVIPAHPFNIDILQGSGQAALEHGEVKTDVGLSLLFPADVFVHVGLGAPGQDELAVGEDVVAARAHEHEVEVGTARHVAGDTVAGAELELIQPCNVLHPVLFGDDPAGGHGREEAPGTEHRVGLGAELGAALKTGAGGEEILAGVVVHAADEEGGQLVLVLVAALVGIGCLAAELALAHAEVVECNLVQREDGVGDVEALAEVGLVALAQEELVAVLAGAAHVVEGVLDNLLGVGAVALGGHAVLAGHFAQGALLIFAVPGGDVLDGVGGGELQAGQEVDAGPHGAYDRLVFLLVVGLVDVGHRVAGVEVVGLVVAAVFDELLVVGVDGHGGVGTDGLVEVVVVGPVLIGPLVCEVVGDVDKALERLLVCGETAGDLVEVGLLGYTLEVAVAHGCAVVEVLRAAGEREVVRVRDRVAGDGLDPVGAGTVVGSQVLGHHVLTVFLCVEHAGHVGDEAHAGVAAVLGAERSVFVAAAGGDEDDAGVGAGAVDGGCGAVLEDVDGLDVGGLHGGEVAAGHAVNDVQRLGGTIQGAHASQLHAVAVLRRVVAAVLDDVQAGHLALQETHGVGHAALVEVGWLEGRHASGDLFLGLRAVSYDDHVVQEFGILGKQHVLGHFGGLERTACITYATYLHDCVRARHGEDELAVQAGGCACGGFFFHDGGSDHRTQGVLDDTLDLVASVLFSLVLLFGFD